MLTSPEGYDFGSGPIHVYGTSALSPFGTMADSNGKSYSDEEEEDEGMTAGIFASNEPILPDLDQMQRDEGFILREWRRFSVAIVSALIANERARFAPNLLDPKERDDALWIFRSRIEEEDDEDEEEEIRVCGVNTGLAIIGIRQEEEASRRAEHFFFYYIRRRGQATRFHRLATIFTDALARGSSGGRCADDMDPVIADIIKKCWQTYRS